MPLIFSGDSTWESAGPNQWHPNGWELDRVIVPMSGDINDKATFEATLNMWDAWGVDGNMFLSDYSEGDQKQFPLINLTYQGKRNGTLPPTRVEVLSSLQQVSGIVFSDSYLLTFGLPPHWEARITYTGQIIRQTTWYRTTPDVNSISAPAAADITAADIASLVIGGIDYTGWPAVRDSYDAIVAWVLQWFFSRQARYANVQELVPSQYFKTVITNQSLLFPIQAQIVT